MSEPSGTQPHSQTHTRPHSVSAPLQAWSCTSLPDHRSGCHKTNGLVPQHWLPVPSGAPLYLGHTQKASQSSPPSCQLGPAPLSSDSSSVTPTWAMNSTKQGNHQPVVNQQGNQFLNKTNNKVTTFCGKVTTLPCHFKNYRFPQILPYWKLKCRH